VHVIKYVEFVVIPVLCKWMKRVHVLTVIWNPWVKALTMADLGEGYVDMLCVEAGHVVEPVHLSPGEQFVGTQTLTVVAK